MFNYKKYNVFYEHLGLFKPSHFVKPRILNINNLIYPEYSAFIYYNPDYNMVPDRTIPMFKPISKGIVTNKIKLDVDKIIIKPHGIIDEDKINKELNKESKDFHVYKESVFLRKIKSNINITKKIRPIVSFNKALDYYYIFTTWKTEYVIYRTIYENIIKTYKKYNLELRDKKRKLEYFLNIPLPTVLPDIALIRKYIYYENDDKELLKHFSNRKQLLILDLFRVLFKDLKDKTIFKNIDLENEGSNLTLTFVQNDKIMFINFKFLLSFSSDYDIKYVGDNLISKSIKFEPKKLKILLYKCLKFFYLLPGFDIKDIENERDIIKESAEEINIEGIKKTVSKVKKLSLKDLEDDSIEEEQEKIMKEIEESIKEEEKKEEVVKIDSVFKSKEKVLKSSDDLEEDIKDHFIDYVKNNEKINEKKKKQLEEDIKSLESLPNPYDKKSKLKDVLKYKEDEIKLNHKEAEIKNDVVLDKSYKSKLTNVLDKEYIRKLYKKDIVNVFTNLSKGGLLMKDYQIETHEDILGKYEEHIVTYKDVKTNTTHNIKIKLPVIDENGVFKMSGNEYIFRKSRLDIPIKKIDPKTVVLSSAYGKLFIVRSPYAKTDVGVEIKKILIAKEEQGEVKNIIFGNTEPSDVFVPEIYMLIGRYIKSFIYKNIEFMFDYDERISFIKDIDPEPLEKKYEAIVIGKDKTSIYFINKDNELLKYDKKSKSIKNLGDLLVFLDIKDYLTKKDIAMIKIVKTYVPVILLLCFYIGFDNLDKILDINIKSEPAESRILDFDNKVIFKLANETIIIEYKDKATELLVSGFGYYHKELKDINRDVLNNREYMKSFFKALGLTINEIVELENLNYLFLDPITINVLKEMKEPTTFIGLLIRAAELLKDGSYLHSNNAKGYLIKTYDKIPQMVYNQIVKALLQKRSEEYFGKSKLNVDPYYMWVKINDDSASVLVNDLNPIAYLKLKEDTIKTGFGGMKKESMSKETREMHKTEVGVISEGSKFTKDVGISTQLSANPKIKNLRGFIDTDSELEPGNIFSTSALNAPFSDADDAKRIMFTGIQNSHVIPFRNPEVYPVRTGYESVIPYRVDRKFVGVAEDEGKVIKVSKNSITVDYKNLGKKTYNFKDWTSKDEAGTTYKHILVPNVTEGMKVNKDDILYYDKTFFEPDIFDNRKVIYRTYINANVALLEDNETNEDSSIITKSFRDKITTTSVKVRSIILKKDDKVEKIAELGDEVNVNDPLIIISSGVTTSEQLDEKTLNLLKDYLKTIPKAKYKGKIIKIEVFYNFDKKEASRSIQKIIDIIEKENLDVLTGKKFSGRVDSSYSINGIPLDEGKLEIKFYIETDLGATTGDKGIIANQLKTTIGNVYEYDIYTESGRKIDILFSAKALAARIVVSPFLMGTTALLLEEVSKKAAEIYFGTDIAYNDLDTETEEIEDKVDSNENDNDITDEIYEAISKKFDIDINNLKKLDKDDPLLKSLIKNLKD